MGHKEGGRQQEGVAVRLGYKARQGEGMGKARGWQRLLYSYKGKGWQGKAKDKATLGNVGALASGEGKKRR